VVARTGGYLQIYAAGVQEVKGVGSGNKNPGEAQDPSAWHVTPTCVGAGVLPKF